MPKATKLEVILDAETARFKRGLQTALRDVESFDKKVKQKTGARGGRGGGILGGLAGGIGIRGAGAGIGVAAIGATVVQSIKLSDEMRNIENRVKNITSETGDFAEVWEEIGNISHRNGQTFETTIDTFQRISFARKDLKATSDEMLEFVDIVQQLGIVSGSSQQAMRSGLIQLAQGLSAGVLRAEEFNSILENLPAVAVELAKAMDISTGQLRQMVLSGNVLSETVFRGLLSRSKEVAEQFDNMAVTLPRAFQSAKNEAMLLIRELDKVGGVSEKLASIIQYAADTMAELHASMAEKRDVHLNFNKALGDVERLTALRDALVEGRAGDVTQETLRGFAFAAGQVPGEGIAPQFFSDWAKEFEESTLQGVEAALKRAEKLVTSFTLDLPEIPITAERIEPEGLTPRKKPTDVPYVDLEKLLRGNKEQLEIDKIRLAMVGESEGAILKVVEAQRLRFALDAMLEKSLFLEDERNDILAQQAPLIDQITTAMGDMVDELEAAEKAEKAAQDAFDDLVSYADDFANAGADALGDWMLGFSSAEEAAASLLSRLAEMVLELTVLTPLANALSNALTGGGQAGGSFLSSLFATTFGGARAGGGPVSAGSSYWVGEKGPELVTPSASGYIHNARKSQGMVQGGGGKEGPRVTMNFPNVTNPEEFARSRSAVKSGLSRAFG